MKLNGATIPDAIVKRVIQRRGARLYERRYRISGGARIARYCAGSQPAGGDGARDWGGVFWIKMTHDERCFSEWSVAYELPTPEYRAKRIAALSEGKLGHELWPKLDIRPEDEIVKKYRYSAVHARNVCASRPATCPRL
jgi:hypothetical protein